MAQTPNWLNKDFFQKVLIKKYKTKNVKICELTKIPISGNGENYCSNMFKIELKFELDGKALKKSVVVKTDTENKHLEKMQLFPKEKEMYEVILPAFEKLFKDVGVDVELGPECLGTGSEPLEYLIMEDLTVKGFTCEDRRVGLDMLHMKQILEKLAKFHAASVVYYKKNGPYSDKFKIGMYSDADIMAEMTTRSVTYLSKFVESWPKGKNYSEIIASWKPNLYKAVTKSTTSNPNGFNVLCHGDLWTNNFMYRHNSENKIEDLLIVDYQICQWTSPAIDLFYLIIESADLSIKVKEFDTFVHYYHSHLVENLKKLNFTGEVPTLLELQIDILERSPIALMLVILHLTSVLLDPSSESNMENFLKDDEAGFKLKKRMYTNPRYIDHMMELLPFFEKKGILNIDGNL